MRVKVIEPPESVGAGVAVFLAPKRLLAAPEVVLVWPLAGVIDGVPKVGVLAPKGL